MMKINSNVLKIFAVITMIIDHVGCYFPSKIAPDTYYLMRSIGRLAMPIFLYLLVQGFFYTKNLKKYIFRIFCLATITQIILLILGIINKMQFPNYICHENDYLGVLYSYMLSLIFISMIEYKKPIKQFNDFFNFVVRIIVMVVIILIYVNVKIEFDMRIPFMCIELYIIEKMFMDKENSVLFLKRNFNSRKKFIIFKLIYILLIELSFVSSLDFSSYHPGYKYAIIFTAIPLFLYNGEKGGNNKFSKKIFYGIFPMQHFVLYLSAMLFLK